MTPPAMSAGSVVQGFDAKQERAIAAVVVTLNPCADALRTLVSDVTKQVGRLIIVDNGSDSDLSDCCQAENAEVIRLGSNLGIAAAQNQGIGRAMALEFDLVLFLDQDSRIPSDFTRGLLRAMAAPNVRIAAPVSFDARYGFGYPLVDIAPSGRRVKLDPAALRSDVDVSCVISSGTLVQRSVFEEVGMFDESLFIDYVDTEWNLRCTKRGIRVRVTPNVRMLHSIGDEMIRLFSVRIPVHSAHRRYYRVRNAFLLARLGHVPKLMALRECLFGLLHQTILIMLCEDRINYLKYYVEAVKDGLLGRGGSYSNRRSKA